MSRSDVAKDASCPRMVGYEISPLDAPRRMLRYGLRPTQHACRGGASNRLPPCIPSSSPPPSRGRRLPAFCRVRFSAWEGLEPSLRSPVLLGHQGKHPECREATYRRMRPQQPPPPILPPSKGRTPAYHHSGAGLPYKAKERRRGASTGSSSLLLPLQTVWARKASLTSWPSCLST